MAIFFHLIQRIEAKLFIYSSICWQTFLNLQNNENCRPMPEKWDKMSPNTLLNISKMIKMHEENFFCPPKVNLTSEDAHSWPCLLKPPVKISISANCHETFFPSVMQTTMNWTNSTSSFTGVHLKAIKWWQFPFTACLH